jgi:hypothetical protein
MNKKENTYQRNIDDILVGRSIKEVHYVCVDYQSEIEIWNLNSGIHSIDMYISFVLDNDVIAQIKWDNEFHCYGLGIAQIDNLDGYTGYDLVEMTSNHKWKQLKDIQISNVQVFWDRDKLNYVEIQDNVTTKTGNEKVTLPQTWEIKFEDKKSIWISAFEIRDDESPNYWADNLTVFFERGLLEEYKLITSTQQMYKSH